MTKFSVNVRRIVREDTTVVVEAKNRAEAEAAAQLEATCVPLKEWEAYECEYWCDPADVKEVQ